MPTKTIDELFTAAVAAGASDIHLAVGRPPLMRVDGSVIDIAEDGEVLTASAVSEYAKKLLSSEQFERFQEEREIDASYQDPQNVRYRVNCHHERDNMGIVARIIPDKIPTMDDVQLPDVAKRLTRSDRGIVLVTGPTGSGKSTTLASMINSINEERAVHIVTLEDPIEFLYKPKKALIRQRQFGTDFLSFEEAMRRVLRQDPDVLLVGEMRDLETISAALTLAETGHLVFATLHTNSAEQTISRMIDVFPPHQQAQIRVQLSMTLKGIIAQNLVPRKGGGRVAMREVLLMNPAVSNIIRDNRVQELKSVLQTSAQQGMITFERDAERLVKMGLLTKADAERFVNDPTALKDVAEPKEATKKKGWFR